MKVEIEALRRMDTEELALRYESLFGRAPRVRNHQYLWRRCAWRTQELRLGGLSGIAKKRLDDLIATIDLPRSETTRSVSGVLVSPAPLPGTTFSREWHGQRVEVRVTDDGFEHNGVEYGSLSAAAKAITGGHWNGRAFFGLERAK